MSNYDKPMVLANEELAEGVYAASGTIGPGGSGWTVNGCKVGENRQDNYSPNPGYYYVNVDLIPGSSDSCTVTLSFNGTINDAVVGGNSASGWSLSYSGSTVTVTRTGTLSGSGYDLLELYVKTQNDNPTCSATVN